MRVFQQLTPRVTAGQVIAFAPPAAFELGNATGFDFELEDVGDVGHDALVAARNKLLGMADARSGSGAGAPQRADDVPQLQARRRSRPRRRARSVAGRRQHHGQRGAGRRVHRPVHRPRPGEEGVHPGRRAVPHQAGGSRQPLCPRLDRRPWRRSRPSPASAGSSGRRGWSATTACRRWRSRARRRPAKAPATAMTRMEALRQAAAARHRLRMDRAFLRGEGIRRRRRAALRALAAGRVPVPRGALRELVGADRGAAGGAARRGRRADRGPPDPASTTTSISRSA